MSKQKDIVKTHIVNPNTGRYIKIGSRSYRELCRDGVIKPDDFLANDEKIVYQVKDNAEGKKLSDEQVRLKLDTAKDLLDVGKYSTLKQGKGVYKNSLVKKKKPLNHEQVRDFTMNIIKNEKIKSLYDSDAEYDSDEINTLIANVINEELE